MLRLTINVARATKRDTNERARSSMLSTNYEKHLRVIRLSSDAGTMARFSIDISSFFNFSYCLFISSSKACFLLRFRRSLFFKTACSSSGRITPLTPRRSMQFSSLQVLAMAQSSRKEKGETQNFFSSSGPLRVLF